MNITSEQTGSTIEVVGLSNDTEIREMIGWLGFDREPAEFIANHLEREFQKLGTGISIRKISFSGDPKIETEIVPTDMENLIGVSLVNILFTVIAEATKRRFDGKTEEYSVRAELSYERKKEDLDNVAFEMKVLEVFK